MPKYPKSEQSLLIADLRRRLESKNKDVEDSHKRRDAALRYADHVALKGEYVINALLNNMRGLNKAILSIGDTLTPEVVTELKSRAAEILKAPLTKLTGDTHEGFLSFKEASQLVAQLQGVPVEEAEKAVRTFLNVVREG